MSLTTMTGVVSGIRHAPVTEGVIGKSGGSVRTGHALAFRVDDRSVQIKLPNMPDVQDGETVTLAGRVKNGTFQALALRNDRTRAIYATPAMPGYIMGGPYDGGRLPAAVHPRGRLFHRLRRLHALAGAQLRAGGEAAARRVNPLHPRKRQAIT